MSDETILHNLELVLKEVYEKNRQRIPIDFKNTQSWKNFVESFQKEYGYEIKSQLLNELLYPAHYRDIAGIIQDWSEVTKITFSELKKFLKNNPQEFYAYAKVDNLTVDFYLKVGNLELTKLTEDKISELKKHGYSHEELNGQKNESVILYGPYQSDCHELALQEASVKFEEFLNILRFFLDFRNKRDSNVITRFGIKDFSYGHIVSFSRNRYLPKTIWKLQVPISKSTVQKLIDLNFESFVKILLKDDKNEVQGKIFDAIHWFGLAKMSYDEKQEFIAYFTALEILLFASSDKGIGADLSEKIPKVFSYGTKMDFEEKKLLAKKVKLLYAKRSRIVHNNEVPSIEQLDDLNDITRQTIYKFLKIIEKHSVGSKEDFIDWTLKTAF